MRSLPRLLKLSGFYKLEVNFDGVPTLRCVGSQDGQAGDPAASSVFVLSDLTVQLLRVYVGDCYQCVRLVQPPRDA